MNDMISVRPGKAFAELARLSPFARVAAGMAVTFGLGLLALLVDDLLLVCDPLLIAMPLVLLSPVALLVLLGLSIASAFKGTLSESAPWLGGAALLVLAVWPAVRERIGDWA